MVLTTMFKHNKNLRNMKGLMRKQWLGVSLMALLAVVFLAVPVIALMLKVPWNNFFYLITQPETFQATLLSLGTSLTAALLCALLGIPLGIWLSEHDGIGALLVRIAVVVPLVMPPLVGGVALIAAFGNNGVISPLLLPFGVQLEMTTTAVIMSQAFVALPFMVITIEAARRATGTRHSRTARELGASSWMTLSNVTLPLLKPAILAGFLLCIARALGEFGASSLFAGSIPGISRTLPQAISTAFKGAQIDESLGFVMAGMLVIFAVIIVASSGLLKTQRQQS